MALNTFERDTLVEIKARVMAKQPVADWERQIILDLLRREGAQVDPQVIERARNSGFNVNGINTI